MTQEQLHVSEWLSYFPIFVDLSQIKSFASWVKKHLKGDIFEKALADIEKSKYEAWISPFSSTPISTLRGETNGFNLEITMQFRLRTLCFEIKSWRIPKDGIKVQEAMNNLLDFEKSLEPFKKRWAQNGVICNVIVVEPYYKDEKEAETWLGEHLENLDFFPINCRLGCSFTLSHSKLIQKDEKQPFFVTSIRDENGVLRKIILICNQKESSNHYPCSYSRPRWAFFSGLIIPCS